MRNLTELEQEALSELSGFGLTVEMLIGLNLPEEFPARNTIEPFSHCHLPMLKKLIEKGLTIHQACDEIKELNPYQVVLLSNWQDRYFSRCDLRGYHLRELKMANSFDLNHAYLIYGMFSKKLSAVEICNGIRGLSSTQAAELYSAFFDLDNAVRHPSTLFWQSAAFFGKAVTDKRRLS
ncbi:MAG: hypothetical protein Q8L78_02275 [Coxiellaceae bacterium]|nr:hypothetical protein [Coxiellaceae bacterium]